MKDRAQDYGERLNKLVAAFPEIEPEIERLIAERARSRSGAASGPLMFGMSAAAKFLGCHRSTLHRICAAGRLRRVEILPGSFRISRSALESFADGKESSRE